MKILQILPELNSGGVERGTVEFAAELVRRGHESLVISNGGRLVPQLLEQGSQHIEFPVHKKSFSSLFRIKPFAELLQRLDVDLIHVRSRVPAWMTFLALKKFAAGTQKPALISTFHGLYSTNRYSEIMGCGDQVIAISECVRDYIVSHYPKIDTEKITVIHRGVDTKQFNTTAGIDEQWLQGFYSSSPQIKDKALILMPGRLSRWKGQAMFIDLIHQLIADGINCHGLIVGGTTPGKDHYLQELKQQISTLDLNNHISLLGHRNDMDNLYRIASVVCNLSQHPEPFGRTVIESLAVGTPVVAFDCGGPAESLRACLPEGLVETNNMDALCRTIKTMLNKTPEFSLPEQFTLPFQADATLKVYQSALAARDDS